MRLPVLAAVSASLSRRGLCRAAPLFGLSLSVVVAACASAPPPAVSTAPPAAPASAAPAAPTAPTAPAKAVPHVVLVWSGAPGEGVPAPIRQALGDRAEIPPGGAIAAASQTLVEARRALTEMRCTESLPKLAQASERVLSEVLLPEARPLLSEIYGLMLLCADRVSDSAVAEQASAALRAMQATVPADVSLVMARHEMPARFGPPRPPVHVESDPPGAVVLRDLVPIGVTPIDVPGGQPERDFIDIELPGFRKLHRPLGSNQQLIFALRPEDRTTVLLDRATLFAPGSDTQESVLRALAETADAQSLPSRLLLVLGPKERSGPTAAGEALTARVYDLERKAWLGTASEVTAGSVDAQGQALLSLCSTAAAKKVAPARPGSAVAAAPAKPAQEAQAPPAKKGWRGLFANTKWYTWVVAGGVVALVAGLLIAERVSPEKITITATH